MNFKNIAVAGSGVLGSQIAFQTAFKGFNVSVYDINDEAIERAKERMEDLKRRYQDDLDASPAEVNAAYDRMSFSSDLA
ncbi:3-hydroxybutyryl-CoA dehydrogenase [Marinicrinis lubricantis]